MNNNKTGGRGRGGQELGSANGGRGEGVSRANITRSEIAPQAAAIAVSATEKAVPNPTATVIAVEKLPAQPSAASTGSPLKPQSPSKGGKPPRPSHEIKEMVKDVRDGKKRDQRQLPKNQKEKEKREGKPQSQLVQAAPAQSNDKHSNVKFSGKTIDDAFSWASHPARDSAEFNVSYTANVLLSLYPEKEWKKIYPSHPGRQLCIKFSRFGGVCDFGMSCKFDHPTKGRSTDEALVDTAAQTLDKPLHEAYTLTFAVIRTVDSYYEHAAVARKELNAAVKELFIYSVEKLHAVCLELLNRHWTLAVSSSSYGLEVTLLYSVIPRCAERVRQFIKGVYGDPLLCDDFDRTFSSIRLALLDRERAALNTMNRGVPLPPRAVGQEARGAAALDTAVAAALGLHRSIMTHSNECTAAMLQTAGIRDGVIEELRALLVPVIYEEAENFLMGNFSAYAGSRAKELGNYFSLDINLLPFGSSANTVGTLTSDLDIVLDITINLYTCDGKVTKFNQLETERLSSFAKKYLHFVLDILNLDEESTMFAATDGGSGPFTLREFVSSARVPVLKLQHRATGIDIDLIEGSTNRMGLLNTQLLRDYASADPRVRPLMLAVKRWAAARCVSVSSNGTLSTYCWMMMVVFFLQVAVTEQDNDAVSPALKLKQLCGFNAKGKETYVLRTQATLTHIHEEIRQQTHESADPLPESEDLVRLLVRFFAFYGTEAENSFRTFENIAVLRENKRLRKRGAHSAEMDRNWQRARARSASMTDETSPRSRMESNATEDLAVKSFGMVTPTKGDVGDADAAEEALDAIVFDMEKNLSIKDERKALQEAAGDAAGAEDVSFTPDVKSKKKENVIDSAIIWRMCIEDPFEQEHDLGSVIRSQIGQSYILTELRRAVSLLHNYLISKTMEGNDLFQVLCTVNENPPDLAYPCHICYSMDHKVKECPRFVCYKCGKHGHFTSQCDGERKKKLVGSQTRANKAIKANIKRGHGKVTE